jgi:hypothetical protein
MLPEPKGVSSGANSQERQRVVDGGIDLAFFLSDLC